MIQLPDNFDITQFYTDIYTFVTPIAGVVFLVAAGLLLLKILRRV